MTLQITKQAITGLIQEILFKKFTPFKFDAYFDCLDLIEKNEQSLKDLAAEM